MNILVTGGAGYIGSHTVIELIREGHTVTVLDNLSNSSPEVIPRMEKICGQQIDFYQCDLRDEEKTEALFSRKRFDCCIHFAGLKSGSESVDIPLDYYSNNVGGTVVLLKVMERFGCRNMIFSSSAAVYGDPDVIPVTEDTPRGKPASPYARTKLMLEDILMDVEQAGKKLTENQSADGTDSQSGWNVVLLRYFNPVGAHVSGLIGEDPSGTPKNLMPYITQTALGKREYLKIFGDDYPTPDGTCIRDYIHITDLAKGHVAALKAIERKCGLAVYNLGTGSGTSVLQMIRAFEKACGIKIPYRIAPRRQGDVPASCADVSKAERELGFKAQLSVEDMCKDSWNWQRKNPQGYGKEDSRNE